MANEVSGGVEYYVDVDTSKAIASTKSIDTQTKKIEKSFKGVDTQVSKTSKAVNAGMASMGRGAGQAGIQFQQFIGQIQGGQNAMLALSQQSADLGFVLGAPLVGAVVGIAASIGGILLPELLGGKKAIDKLTEATEALDKVVKQTPEGVNVLSSSIEKLATKSEAAAKVEIALGIVKAKEAIKAASEEIEDATRSFEGFFTTNASSLPSAISELENLEKASKRTGETQIELLSRLGDSYEGALTGIGALSNATQDLSKEYGITQTQALGLVKVFGQFENSKTPETMQAVATAVSSIAINADKPNKKLIELAKRINEASIAATNGADVVKLLDQALDDFSAALDESSESANKQALSVQGMVKALEAQAETLGFTERQLALYAATSANATEADIAAINAAYDKIEAFEANAKATKENEAALKKYNDETFRQLQAEERLAQSARNKAAAEQQGKERSAVGFAEGIVSRGLSPAENLEIQEQELESIRAQGLINLELYEQAKTSIVEQQEKLRQQASIASQNLILMSASSFFGETAELVKNSAGEQSSAYKTLFAISKGFAIANAALNLGTALSNASALPYPVNIPAFIQAGVQGAQLASQIASVSYGGGRENGGPVSGNKLYEVGEKNKPELFQSGGKQYMIPGNNGNVTSNADMQGGGGNLNVKVVNLPGQTAQVSQSGEGVNRETVIQIIGQQSGSVGSEMNRNINKNHNVTNRLASNRRN